MKKLLVLLSLFVLILAGCGDKEGSSDSNESSNNEVLKVASLISPMTDILELIKPQLLEEGIELEVVVLSNNVMPNEALASKEVDANFFQHVPYMEQFNRSKGSDLVPVTPIYFANYGVYAKKYDSFDALPDGATVAIANDISNIDRSLQLLAQHGVIKLQDKTEPYWTVKDVIDNPKNLKFEEVDLLMLSRMYEDADAVVMTPAYAAPLGLTPKSDAIFTEGVENEFAITLVAREDNKNDKKIKKLAKAMTSPEVKKFLEENYEETAIPAFK